METVLHFRWIHPQTFIKSLPVARKKSKPPNPICSEKCQLQLMTTFLSSLDVEEYLSLTFSVIKYSQRLTSPRCHSAPPVLICSQVLCLFKAFPVKTTATTNKTTKTSKNQEKKIIPHQLCSAR